MLCMSHNLLTGLSPSLCRSTLISREEVISTQTGDLQGQEERLVEKAVELLALEGRLTGGREEIQALEVRGIAAWLRVCEFVSAGFVCAFPGLFDLLAWWCRNCRACLGRCSSILTAFACVDQHLAYFCAARPVDLQRFHLIGDGHFQICRCHDHFGYKHSLCHSESRLVCFVVGSVEGDFSDRTQFNSSKYCSRKSWCKHLQSIARS